MAEVICRVCSDILPPTKRRQIFSSAFQVSSQLSQVLCYNPQQNDGLSSCICLACYSKLNRMCKIDFDLQHRLDQLRQEKTQIVSLLRSKMKFHPVKLQGASFKYPSGSVQEDCGTSGDIAASSPKDPGKRKSIARTPTPRKPKQAMLHTPRKHGKARLLFGDSSECSSIDLAQALPGDQEKTAADATIEPSKPTVPAATPCTPAGKSVMLKSTQSLFSPGHMRVQHRGKAGSIRSRVIRNSSSKSIVASICRGSSCDNIAKTIIKSDLKWNVTDALLRNLGTECKNLCSQAKPTLLQNVSPANLKAMRFDRIDAEFQIEAPILYKTLSCLTGGAETAIVTAGAVCLFARNPRMSLFQHAVGQVLDHSGATNEAIRTLNKLGISVSTPSVERQRKSLQQEQEKRVQEMFHSQDKDNACGSTSIGTSHPVEVIGDNIDITRNPSQMTKERKRKSWHWFLLLGVQKRVLFPDLPDEKPKADISQMDNATFVPSPSDCQNLEQNFMHHIMHVLVKFVPCLKDLKSCLPTHIEHPYQNETSQKTSYTVLDMLDKSENKTDEMITILEHIHENYIPHHGNPPSVIQKKVFGGDCLTNERAYAAQLALLNSPTDHTRLSGIIHRPEGLHRMMNLCLVS